MPAARFGRIGRSGRADHNRPSRRGACSLGLAFALSLVLAPALSGCFAGTLDRGHVPRGRVAFGEPPLALALEVAPTFLDATDDAPPILGWLLAQGAARIARASHLFEEVGEPGAPLLGRERRVVRLEGEIYSFALLQDFRVILAYLPVFAIPVPGAGVALTAIALLLGSPMFADRSELGVEVRLRCVETGQVLGRYRGHVEETFYRDLWSIQSFTDSLWERPDLLLSLALRQALEAFVADRRAYRRLAAGQGP